MSVSMSYSMSMSMRAQHTGCAYSMISLDLQKLDIACAAQHPHQMQGRRLAAYGVSLWRLAGGICAYHC